MKNIIIILTLIAISTQFSNAQIGFNANTFTGSFNTAAGQLNTVAGQSNTALGERNSIIGSKGLAAGFWNSVDGLASFSLGTRTYAIKNHAMAFGIDVRANQNRSMIIGTGVDNGSSNAMQNNIPNSLMIGFNSTIPTMFISSSSGLNTLGNVGIGTTTPQSRLHVNGDIRTTKNHRIIFGQGTDGIGEWIQNSNPISNSSNTSGSHGLAFFGNSLERMRITNQGMIGISRNNPTATLHVAMSPNQSSAPSFVRFENLPIAKCGFIVMADENGYLFRSSKKGSPCIDTGVCESKSKEESDIFQTTSEMQKQIDYLLKEVKKLTQK